MSKKIILGVCFLIFIMPTILAVNVQINTLGGGHKVSVFFREVGTMNTIASKNFVLTGSGNVLITEEISQTKVDILVNLYNEGVKVFGKNFEDVPTDELITINNFFEGGDPELVIGTPEPEVVEEVVEEELVVENETIVEEEVVVENETNWNLQAAVIGLKESGNIKFVYYIIGGLGILGFLFFGIRTVKKKLDIKPNVKSSQNFKVINPQGITATDSELEDAERKLDEAKKEIDELKNRKKKLNEVRERIKKDREELRELEGE